MATAGTSAPLVRVKSLLRVRLAFIHSLRILLVTLLMLHHLAVTYGGEGSWCHSEGRADQWVRPVGGMDGGSPWSFLEHPGRRRAIRPTQAQRATMIKL